MRAHVLCLSFVLCLVVCHVGEVAAAPGTVGSSSERDRQLARGYQPKAKVLSGKADWLGLGALDLGVIKQAYGSFSLLPLAIVFGGLFGYGGLLAAAIIGPFVSLKRGGSMGWGVFAVVIGSMHMATAVLVPLILGVSSGNTVSVGLYLGIGTLAALIGGGLIALGVRNIALFRKRNALKSKKNQRATALQWEISPWVARTTSEPGLQGGLMVQGSF